LERSAIPRVAAILSQLNQKASLLMRQFDVHACTDITGFGLAGHAYEMSGGRFTMQFDYGALPFVPEALPLARECIVPGGSYANQAYLEPMTAFEAEQGDDILFYDAQTSGGLLMAVSATDAPKLREALIAEGYAYTTIIGEVLPLQEKALIVR
jgi:selenide,water dikinase